MVGIDELIRDNNLDSERIDNDVAALKQRVEAYRLAEARKKRHMTQAELASKMGISQKRVSEVENGRISSLRIATLERYAEGIGGKLRVSIDLSGEEIPLEA